MRKLLACLLFLAVACGPNNNKSEQAYLDSLKNTQAPAPEIDDAVLGEIIERIPSPLEISFLIKQVGTKYDRSILNTTDNLSKYNSNFQKAINLGIYGTDLGYTNIYKQNQDAISYLNGIKELADGLSIGQFFDFATIKRLATNSSNLDSLLLITTQNFNKINQYLQDQKRSNLSIIILTGGWLEALHITCQVNKLKPNKELSDKIGEQKIIIDQLMLLLGFYSSNPDVAQFITDLTPLHDVFNQIEIQNTYQESTFKEVDGVLTVVNNSTSTIKISEQNLLDITRISEEVRKRVITP
jgi:hypothetical protein